MSEPSDKRRRTVYVLRLLSFQGGIRVKKIILISLTVIILIAVYLFWSNNSLTVSKYTVSPQNLPQSFDGYRIVQISDLHNKNFHGRLIKKIRSYAPDIIVITGDIIDSYQTKPEIALDFAKKALEIAPVYYVAGNHENRIEIYPRFRESLIKSGVTVLDCKGVTLEKEGGEIFLAGMDDLTFFGSSVIDEKTVGFTEKLNALAAEKGGRTGILLSHRPEIFEAYVQSGFDLVFTGHAHGGQIRLPFVGGILTPNQGFFPEYDAGLFEKENTSMIISRGLGNSLFPFRIGNRPEIVVCELE